MLFALEINKMIPERQAPKLAFAYSLLVSSDNVVVLSGAV